MPVGRNRVDTIPPDRRGNRKPPTDGLEAWLADKVEQRRQALEMTYREVADRSGYNITTVSQVLRLTTRGSFRCWEAMLEAVGIRL